MPVMLFLLFLHTFYHQKTKYDNGRRTFVGVYVQAQHEFRVPRFGDVITFLR